MDFLVQRIPHPETPYEMTFYGGLHTAISGPTKGRARAAEGVCKHFSTDSLYRKTYEVKTDCSLSYAYVQGIC